MDKKIVFVKVIIFCAYLFQLSFVKAQFIVNQIEQEIPFSYSLIPGDTEFESEEAEANFILKVPLEDLKNAALSDGQEIMEEKLTLYIEKDRFAAETYSDESGKTTMVSDASSGKITMIMWSQKKVVEINPEDMKQIEEQANQAMEDVIKDMPPEMQEQVRAEMMNEKGGNTSSSYDVLPTGKKEEINGFPCEEYIIQAEEEYTSLWLANDNYGIYNAVKQISAKIEEIFEMSEDNGVDEWQIVPGKIPVQVRSFTYDMMMGDPIVSIQTITKIEKTNPPADKFRVPGEDEGYTKTTYIEMMQQLMPEE